MSPFGPDDADAVEGRKNGGKPRPRGTLPRLPGDTTELEAWLTAAFRPPGGYRLDLFERAGSQRTDPCSITFRNGRDHRTFRFNRQADLMGAQLRPAVLGISDGWLRMGHLTGSEVDDVWAGLCIYGRVMTEYDERDETRKWVEMLLDDAEAMTGLTLVPDHRHDALMRIRSRGQFTRSDALALVRGQTERWISVDGSAAPHVRRSWTRRPRGSGCAPGRSPPTSGSSPASSRCRTRRCGLACMRSGCSASTSRTTGHRTRS